MVYKPLSYSFFQQPTITLARALLGNLLVKETELGTVSGWIVETEAYIGPEDRAAHGFENRRTKRTEVMFGPPGYAYTYVMHTHCLINVVSGEIGCPEAVLFTINIPSENYVRETDYFGMVSGKKEDKFAKTGLTPVKSDFVDAPYISEFPVNLCNRSLFKSVPACTKGFRVSNPLDMGYIRIVGHF